METLNLEDTLMNYDNSTATLGDRIEAARSSKDMDRSELAERLGVKKSTIKKWEQDQSEPRSNRLYMMAGVLDCNVMWLLNGEGDAPMQTIESNEQQRIQALKAELRDLNKDLERMSRRVKAMETQL